MSPQYLLRDELRQTSATANGTCGIIMLLYKYPDPSENIKSTDQFLFDNLS